MMSGSMANLEMAQLAFKKEPYANSCCGTMWLMLQWVESVVVTLNYGGSL